MWRHAVCNIPQINILSHLRMARNSWATRSRVLFLTPVRAARSNGRQKRAARTGCAHQALTARTEKCSVGNRDLLKMSVVDNFSRLSKGFEDTWLKAYWKIAVWHHPPLVNASLRQNASEYLHTSYIGMEKPDSIANIFVADSMGVSWQPVLDVPWHAGSSVRRRTDMRWQSCAGTNRWPWTDCAGQSWTRRRWSLRVAEVRVQGARSQPGCAAWWSLQTPRCRCSCPGAIWAAFAWWSFYADLPAASKPPPACHSRPASPTDTGTDTTTSTITTTTTMIPAAHVTTTTNVTR